MRAIWQSITYKIASGSKLYLLVAINVAVYLLINVPAVIEQLFTGFGNSSIIFYTNKYLLLPADLHTLLFRFWTPFTYMFMHAGIFHILFNMLWLYWLGQIFEEFLGNKRILGLYLLGGLAGAFLFVLCYNTLPAFTSTNAAAVSVIVGASASVMAVIIATATQLPNYTIPIIFIGPVKLKWLAAFYLIIDFLSITGPNAGGEIAHIGGAILGFVYIKQLQKGRDMVGSIAGIFKPKSKLKVATRSSGRGAQSRPRQEDVDHILDKISQHGYDHLSKEEKEILFRASKNES